MVCARELRINAYIESINRVYIWHITTYWNLFNNICIKRATSSIPIYILQI